MSSISSSAPSRQPMIEGYAADDATIKRILETHSPDGRNIDVKFLLHSVADVLMVPDQSHSDKDEKFDEAEAVFESLIVIIYQVSDEINNSKLSSGGTDADKVTMSILKKLSNYSWDVKLVIALAAFAMVYGEFFLVVQSYNPSDPAAKSVAILKQISHIQPENPRLKEIKDLIKVMINIADSIIKFKELPSKYMDETAFHVYWTVRSILACASQINALIAMGTEHIASTAESSLEMSSISQKLEDMKHQLEKKFTDNQKTFEEETYQKTFEKLSGLLNKPPGSRIDNRKVLEALISTAKDDRLPLIKDKDKRASIDELPKSYYLLLLVSNFMEETEIINLQDIYKGRKSQEKNYEIVWLPIIDDKKKFDKLRSGMTWYTADPTLIDPTVIKYIKQEWHFGKKPMLVVLDPQGRVACLNALYMMWIWGNLAFPFTTSREEELWKNEQILKLEFLLDKTSDPRVEQWINEKKYTCLYGGDDKDWIRKFIIAATKVAQAAGICLEMVYVGKRNPNGRVQSVIDSITKGELLSSDQKEKKEEPLSSDQKEKKKEPLSRSLQDLISVWYFWVRIESMWRSKNQLKADPKNDQIMKDILTILTFDSMENGWALFGRKSDDEMVKANGDMMLKCLENDNDWTDPKFIPKLRDQLEKISKDEQTHCNKLLLPADNGVPKTIPCGVCGNDMERFSIFSCCKKEN